MIPIMEYFILFFAVSAIFSSPAEVRYWIPEMIKAMMPRKPKIPRSQFMKFFKIRAIGILESPVLFGTQTPATGVKLPEGQVVAAVAASGVESTIKKKEKIPTMKRLRIIFLF